MVFGQREIAQQRKALKQAKKRAKLEKIKKKRAKLEKKFLKFQEQVGDVKK